MATKRNIKIWLTLFVGFVALFILLQLPASWLLNKFAPNLRTLTNVTGNIWQGQADWQMAEVKGTLNWSTRPWELIRLRMSSNISIHSGQTELTGIVGYSVFKKVYFQNVNGKISSDTLGQFVAWQWPSSTIQIKDTKFNFKKGEGFSDGEGQWAWSGGALNYPMAQRMERIDVPPLVANIETDQSKLKLLVRNSQQQKMADLVIGEDGMLDVQVTQRFLLHSPSYKGQAGLDTAVISTRQPLRSLRGM